MRDALRLAFGTLTVLPVRPPGRVDRGTAGWAMALGPPVGGVLGLVAVAAVLVLRGVLGPLPTAVLVVVLLAVATRLLHWDGLADTADGLGSGRPATEALDIMRRSDTGPFGVFAIVAVFAVQAGALAALLGPAAAVGAAGGLGDPATAGSLGAVGGVVVAAVLGRCALLVACRAGVPAARPEGLGAAVAGSVDVARLAVGTAVAAGIVVAAGALDVRLGWWELVLTAGVAVTWAVAATAYLRHRLGGMTGDTLGALVETTTAVALVVLAAA